jgi:hypothetical protein
MVGLGSMIEERESIFICRVPCTRQKTADQVGGCWQRRALTSWMWASPHPSLYYYECRP